MTVLPICITGDPVLHAPSREITGFDDELRTLVADMFETCAAAPGVGLAAPQVGLPLRLFVYDWSDDDGTHHRGVAANPSLLIAPIGIEPADEDDDDEGCLSIPGERRPLRRSLIALLRAQDEHGTPYELEATGWLARIWQHEYDHLDGILYADRLEREHAKAIAKVIKRERWGVPGNSWTPGVDDIEA